MSDDGTVEIRRLDTGDCDVARSLFATMQTVFGEAAAPLGDMYVDTLLARAGFWAVVATVDGDVVGGLTAHALPLTSGERSGVFIYDIAVAPPHQRRGIGRSLVAELRRLAASAGLGEIFVAADNDDAHALDFYRALGGAPTPATIFTFPGSRA